MVVVQRGKSLLIALHRPATRISVGDPEIAEIVLVSPTEVLVNGRKEGETTLIMWDQGGIPEMHTIAVQETNDRQVLLEVMVGELNRTAMEDHGVDYRVLREELGLVFQPGKVAPLIGQFPPTPPDPLFQFNTGDPVTLAVLDPKSDVAAFFQFVQREGLGKILAEPRLLARSGKEAKFLSGGEIPIVIAEALQTSVVFKEFGIRVRFKPTVRDDDAIDLEVAPEVSEPDFANGINLFGFRIPAFITRRADTRVTLRSGESLLIAGLFRETREENEQKVPYIGDIPFFGYLFRRTSYERTKSELMIVVKPRLVRATPAGRPVPFLDREPFRRDEVRTQGTEANVTRPRLGPRREPDEMLQAPPAEPAEPAARNWKVQVLATYDREDAGDMIRRLKSLGYPAYLAEMQVDGRTVYRVRVGPFVSVEEADATAERLRLERGMSPVFVTSN